MSVRLQRVRYTDDLWDGAGVASPLWNLLAQKDRLVEITTGAPPYQVVLGVPHHGAPGVEQIAEDWVNPKTGQMGRTSDDSAGLFGLACFTVLREAGISARLLIACHPTDHDPNKVPGPYWEAVFQEPLPKLLLELHGAARHRRHDLELSAGQCAGARPDLFGKAMAHFLRGPWILAVQKEPGISEAFLFKGNGHTSGRLQNPALETAIFKAAGEQGLEALHLEMKYPFRQPDPDHPTAPTPTPAAWRLARAIKDSFMALNVPIDVHITAADVGMPGTAFLTRAADEYLDSYLEANREASFQEMMEYAELRAIAHVQVTRLVESLQKPFYENMPDEPAEDILWLIDQGEYIGRVFFYHWLTDEHRQSDGQVDYWIRPSRRGQGYGPLLLRMVLERFRQLGLDRVLISVLSDNAASIHIIEAAGGEFEGEEPEYGTMRRRYWIKL